VRQFETGATRNSEEGKYDYEGFLSPLVVERFAEYMHKHRVQADGKLRDSDNWQKGMPRDAYMKSGYRHFFDWWKEHRGHASREGLEDALCALLFNVQGYLHEVLLKRDVGKQEPEPDEQKMAVAAALCFGRPMNANPKYMGEDDPNG
jgi:hypothetical protein